MPVVATDQFADAASAALVDIAILTRAIDVEWALVGGLALRAHGVPRDTLDVDALVAERDLLRLAVALVAEADWVPLQYSVDDHDYVPTDEPTVHTMDDPVLFDIGEVRAMIPMQTPGGLVVDFLAAQHSIEQDMIAMAVPVRYLNVRVPIAPLGGILLVKTKADRTKDVAAIEQVAEHTSPERLVAAIAWARERDETTAEDLRAIIEAARARKAATPRKNWRPRDG